MLGSARLLITHHRVLIRVTRTEIAARYAGSVLGTAWILLAPLSILGIYALVYLEVLRIRPPGLSSSLEYVLYIFAGLVPYLATAEAVSGGVVSVVSSKAVLTNTVFPIDLSPVKPVLMSLGTLAVGLTIVVAGTAATGDLGPAIAVLPLVVAMQVLMLIGVAWLLAPLNVVFRDLQNLVGTLLMLLLIASPIAYTPEMVPHRLRFFLDLNPFSYFTFAYQRATVLSRFPGLPLMAGLALMTAATFLAGSWFFHRAKRVVVDYV